MFKVEDISVDIGGIKLVDSVSFELGSGDWLMIAGPNGAGKSTLINAATRGIAHTGKAFLDGKDIATIKPKMLAQSIGVLAQKNEVSYSFTVQEVVAMGRYAHSAGIFGKSGDEDDELVQDALAMTGLQSRRDQSVLTLSGGELQRVFLAQIFAQNPRILILDEPSNHLDIQYQMQLFDLIENWLKQKNRAVIAVVHDLSLARLYGNSALLLDNGKAIAYGEKDEVFCRKNLEQVYGMDVYGWLNKLGQQWNIA